MSCTFEHRWGPQVTQNRSDEATRQTSAGGMHLFEASFSAGYAARILPFRRDLSQVFLVMDSLGS